MKSLNCPGGFQLLSSPSPSHSLAPEYSVWYACFGLYKNFESYWMVFKNVTLDGALVHVIGMNLETEISHVHNQSINHVYTMEH